MISDTEVTFHKAMDEMELAMLEANRALDQMVDEDSIEIIVNGERCKVSRAIASKYTLADLHDAEAYRMQYEHLVKYLEDRYSAFVRDDEVCMPYELIQDEIGEDIPMGKVNNYIRAHMDSDTPRQWTGSFIPVAIIASFIQEVLYDV